MLAGDAEVDPRTQEALVTMAKAVAAATGALVTNARCTNAGSYQLRISHVHMLCCALPSSLSSSLPFLLPPFPPSSLSSFLPPFLSLSSFLSRNVAARCEDQALQNQVIVSAKQTALATQALIACTKVVAPCIDSPLCQEQLIEACKMVAAAVEKIVLAAQVRIMSPYMEVSKHASYVWKVSCMPSFYTCCYIWKSQNTHHIWKSFLNIELLYPLATYCVCMTSETRVGRGQVIGQGILAVK